VWLAHRGSHICWGQGFNDIGNLFSCSLSAIPVRVLTALYFIFNLYLNMLTTFLFDVLKEKVFRFFYSVILPMCVNATLHNSYKCYCVHKVSSARSFDLFRPSPSGEPCIQCDA
jgi:hypothetical protein